MAKVTASERACQDVTRAATRARSAAAMRAAADGDPLAAGAAAGLTDRERQVLALLADGLSTKEVGRRLGISQKTTESHRQKMRDRLGLSGVAELTKFAVLAGLSPIDGPGDGAVEKGG